MRFPVKKGWIGLIYRKANNDDIKRLVELRLGYLEDDHGKLSDAVYDQIRTGLPEYFKNHLDYDLIAYVAEDANQLLVSSAFLLIKEMPMNPDFIKGRVGTVLNVFTEKNYRRQGVAGKLMEMLLQDAKEKQLDYVELQATKDGWSLYKKLGFKEKESNYVPMKYSL